MSRLDPPASAGWFAVGDAAAALDPLSSHGVYRALVSGLEAAAAIHNIRDGSRDTPEVYALGVITDFTDDLHARADYYSRVRRWAGEPFWHRRQTRYSGSGPT
jgi:flavin-dependent dehydrogenase